MTTAEPTDAIVIGAGPMGLTTAWNLTQLGMRVRVFEADDRIGGMSAHFDFDGLRAERYYHFICKPDAPLLDLLDRLQLSDKVRWATTRMGFFYDGQLYEWGRPDALLRFPHLGRREKLRYAAHVLRSRFMRDWRTLDRVEGIQWMRDWLGDHAYDVLWSKSFDLKFHEHQSVSAAWIATRIRRVGSSRRDAFHEEMGYLEGGSEVLLKALQFGIEAGGGEIVLNTPVQEVLTEGGRVRGVRAGGAVHPAERVISTAPIQLVPALVPALTPAESARIRAIENIGVVCAKFKLSERFTDYFWINVNDDRIGVPGVIEYTNLNPLPEHVVYVPYYMPPTHPKWSWSSQEITADARSVLEVMRPDWDPGTIRATHVSRYLYAQPICGPGFADALPPIRTSIRGFVMADTSYCYPEDRSISESVRIAAELTAAAESP